MSDLPEALILQEIVELISEANEADITSRDFVEVLNENISYICKDYELTEEDRIFILDSFISMEEQGNSKTMNNASKAQKLINKKR